jgi:hypothetical protein
MARLSGSCAGLATPHFFPICGKALGAAGFTAEVQFGEPRVYPDRRAAADSTHDEIAAMRCQEALVLQ